MQEYVIGADIKRDNVARMLLHLTAPEQLAAQEEKRLKPARPETRRGTRGIGFLCPARDETFRPQEARGRTLYAEDAPKPASVEIRDELLIPPED